MHLNMKGLLSVAISALLLIACDSPEEIAQNHLQKGKELFEKGEYEKAILELKTSSQSSGQNAETYYYMALVDEKTNSFKSMQQNLLKALELNNNMLEARQKLGKLFLLFGDFPKALEQAEILLNANPNNQDAQLLKASIYFKQSKKEEAAGIVDSILKANPDNMDAVTLKAVFYFEKNDIDNALSLIDNSILKDTKNLPLRLFRIKINTKRNNLDAVINDYKEIISMYPDAQNFKLSLASIYSMNDKLEQAEALLREMVDKDKGKVEPKIVLLEFLNARSKDRVIGEFDAMIGSVNQPKEKLELSKWMLTSGFVEEATKGLKQVVDSENNNNLGLTAQAILAEIAFSKKDYSAVESSVANILSANPDFIDASLLKSRLLLTQNKVDEAIELLNKIVWTKKDSDSAYTILGQAYSLKNDQKQAELSYKQALEINPANLSAFFPVYASYIQANQRATARQYLDKALKVKPHQALLLTNKADMDIAEKRWDEAQDSVQKIALFSKNKAVPLYLQANILQGKGQYADAVNLYEKLLGEFPEHLNSMINLTRCYEALNARDKAIAFFESLHGKFNHNLTVAGVLADLYMSNNEYVKAKQLLTSQLSVSPDKSVTLYLALAKVEAKLSKNVDSIKDVYLKGLEVNPDSPELLNGLATLAEQTGDKAGAQKLYQKIVDKYPEDTLAVNNLAAMLIESSNNEDLVKGLTLSEKFKDANNPSLQDTYAWALLKNGRTAESLKILEDLIVKEPKMPELRYHLGVAHFNSGHKATAIAELRNALNLAEKQQRGFAGINEAKKLLQDLEHIGSR